MKLAFDWDGVIMDTGKYEAEMAEYLFEANLSALTGREHRALTRLVSLTELALLVQPVPCAVEHMLMLQQEGHEIRIVTSRDGDFLAMARRIALRHDLSLDFYGVGRKKNKAPALQEWELFVDDEVGNLFPLEGVVPHRILFSHEYNRDCYVPSGVVRVASWQELYRYIQCLHGDQCARRATTGK